MYMLYYLHECVSLLYLLVFESGNPASEQIFPDLWLLIWGAVGKFWVAFPPRRSGVCMGISWGARARTSLYIRLLYRNQYKSAGSEDVTTRQQTCASMTWKNPDRPCDPTSIFLHWLWHRPWKIRGGDCLFGGVGWKCWNTMWCVEFWVLL